MVLQEQKPWHGIILSTLGEGKAAEGRKGNEKRGREGEFEVRLFRGRRRKRRKRANMLVAGNPALTACSVCGAYVR